MSAETYNAICNNCGNPVENTSGVLLHIREGMEFANETLPDKRRCFMFASAQKVNQPAVEPQKCAYVTSDGTACGEPRENTIHKVYPSMAADDYNHDFIEAGSERPEMPPAKTEECSGLLKERGELRKRAEEAETIASDALNEIRRLVALKSQPAAPRTQGQELELLHGIAESLARHYMDSLPHGHADVAGYFGTPDKDFGTLDTVAKTRYSFIADSMRKADAIKNSSPPTQPAPHPKWPNEKFEV